MRFTDQHPVFEFKCLKIYYILLIKARALCLFITREFSHLFCIFLFTVHTPPNCLFIRIQ